MKEWLANLVLQFRVHTWDDCDENMALAKAHEDWRDLAHFVPDHQIHIDVEYMKSFDPTVPSNYEQDINGS